MKNIIIIFIISLFNFKISYALIEVDITRGNLDPLPIAVSPLHVDIKSTEHKGIKVKDNKYITETLVTHKGSNMCKIVISEDTIKT